MDPCALYGSDESIKANVKKMVAGFNGGKQRTFNYEPIQSLPHRGFRSACPDAYTHVCSNNNNVSFFQAILPTLATACTRITI